VGLAKLFSREQVWRQLQQLIVWRAMQPRSQLVKVRITRDSDVQAPRVLAQQAI